ncbi:MAG TPA: hypothetical protein PLE30_06270 [Candidatus Kapabacteria bacterium]|nr:hypothetical protein [Candidatus Kapabacteria bacterium]
MRIFNYILLTLIAFLSIACVQTPQVVDLGKDITCKSGDIIVVCEGLMGYDNSDLSVLEVNTGLSSNNYFTNNNPKSALGDTANDALLKGDTLIVCSTGASFVNFINIENGKSEKIILLPADCKPRKMALLNDSILAMTDLIKSRLLLININQDSVVNWISVGPQPEGVAIYNNFIFTSNSAYGDFNYKHPDAHTISVVDLRLKKEIQKIQTGINPIEILVNDVNKKMYVAYIHLPSKVDSMGGIIEYDLQTFEKLREWRCYPRSLSLNKNKGELFYINQMNGKNGYWKGVSKIDLISGDTKHLIENKSNDIWYGLNIDDLDGSIWIANAKNHINNGEALMYANNEYTSPKYRFETSINPNKFIFIK